MSRFAFTPLLGATIFSLLLYACSPAGDSPAYDAGPTCVPGGSNIGTGFSVLSAGGSCGTGASSGSGGVGGRAGEAMGGSSGTGSPANSSGGRGGGEGDAGARGSGGAMGSAGRLGSGGQGGDGMGSGGQAGGPAAGGGGGGAKPAAMPSAGCGTPTGQALNQWVEGMVTSAGASRLYSVRLPTGYDVNRAYPVIVLLHGCTSGTNNVPMERVTGTDAILVRGTGSAANTCWNTAANGSDVAFFDAMVADVKARFCADQGRFFVVGYSSGSWLANRLTCIRSAILRGAATVTGGEAASATCQGPVARMFIHDTDDTENVISGSERARDRMLTQNACDKAMPPVAQDPSPCVGYVGCPVGYPVVWCATSGNQHGRQDNFAPAAFWTFFKQF